MPRKLGVTGEKVGDERTCTCLGTNCPQTTERSRLKEPMSSGEGILGITSDPRRSKPADWFSGSFFATSQTNVHGNLQRPIMNVSVSVWPQVQTVNYQFVCSPRQNDKSRPASVRPAVQKMSYRGDIWSTVVGRSIKNVQPFWGNRQRH